MLDIVFDELVEARFEDRDFALLQTRDLALVLVDAGDDMAEVGEACAGDEADIAGADHGNAHCTSLRSRA